VRAEHGGARRRPRARCIPPLRRHTTLAELQLRCVNRLGRALPPQPPAPPALRLLLGLTHSWLVLRQREDMDGTEGDGW